MSGSLFLGKLVTVRRVGSLFIDNKELLTFLLFALSIPLLIDHAEDFDISASCSTKTSHHRRSEALSSHNGAYH